jgi:hypothetical protein
MVLTIQEEYMPSGLKTLDICVEVYYNQCIIF